MKARILIRLLVVSALAVGGCKNNSGKEFCELEATKVAPPDSISELLHYTNVFLVGGYSTPRETNSEELGWNASSTGCVDCYKRSTVQAISNTVFAIDSLEGPIGDVVTLCDVCQEYTEKQLECDGGEPPRDGSNNDCQEVDVTKNTCSLPEWHYSLPDDTANEWAMFLWKDPREGYEVASMAFRLEVIDGSVDLSILEGGNKIPLSEIEQYLIENVEQDNPRFLP